jgi:hypothetical protein
MKLYKEDWAARSKLFQVARQSILEFRPEDDRVEKHLEYVADRLTGLIEQCNQSAERSKEDRYPSELEPKNYTGVEYALARREHAFRLRLQGLTLKAIGERLGVSPGYPASFIDSFTWYLERHGWLYKIMPMTYDKSQAGRLFKNDWDSPEWRRAATVALERYNRGEKKGILAEAWREGLKSKHGKAVTIPPFPYRNELTTELMHGRPPLRINSFNHALFEGCLELEAIGYVTTKWGKAAGQEYVSVRWKGPEYPLVKYQNV